MITENVCTPLGIFNGGACKFIGALYLPNCIEILVKENSLPSIPLIGAVTQEAFEVSVSGQGEYIPVGTEVKENDEKVNYNNIDQIPTGSKIELHLPQTFPSLPDYLVVQIEDFDAASPDTLKPLFPDNPELKDCTLLAPRKINKESRDGEKTKSYTTRRGFMVELSAAYTTYKAIGATHDKSVWMMKGLVDKPGCAYVGLTRIRTPKDLHIPPAESFSALDYRLQRLKPVVLECDNFEREIRIKCAQLEVYLQLTPEQQDIANIIVTSWRNLVKNTDKMLEGHNINVDTFNHVLSQLQNTDVELLLTPTPLLTPDEKNMLEQHQKTIKAQHPTSAKGSKPNGKGPSAFKKPAI